MTNSERIAWLEYRLDKAEKDLAAVVEAAKLLIDGLRLHLAITYKHNDRISNLEKATMRRDIS